MARMTAELIVSLIDKVTAPSRAVTQAIDSLTRAQKRNVAAMNAARGQMRDAVAVAYMLARALGKPIEAATSFESAMADVRKVSGFDDAGLSEFGRQLRKVATSEIPMAVTELAALAAAAAQAGVADNDLLDFTKMAAKAAVAWEMSGQKTGDDLAHIKTALGLTVPELGLYADAINHLSNNSAAAAPQLVDFALLTAKTGEYYGFSKEQSLAFGDAMIASGFQTEVAATSFRNMGRALTKGASATKRQRNAMKELGLDAVKVAARMQKDAVGTTLDVMARINQMPKEVQASIMSDIFGDEARALIPLIGNLDELQRVLKLVGDQKNYFGSAQAEFEQRSKTFENAVVRLNAQLNDLAISIGAALLPPLNDLLDWIGPIIIAISDWAEANPELVKSIVAVTTALVGLRIVTAATRYGFLFMKGGVIDAALAFVKFGAAAKAAASPAAEMVRYQRALAASSGVKYTGLRALVDVVKGLALAVPGVSGLSGALTAIGAAVAGITAPVWATVAAIVALAAAIGILVYKYWEPISGFFTGFGQVVAEGVSTAMAAIGGFVVDRIIDVGKLFGIDEATMNTAVESAKAGIQAAWDGIVGWLWNLPGQVGNWMGDLFKMEDFSGEEEKGFQNAGRQAAEAVLQAVSDSFANAGAALKLTCDIGAGAVAPILQWLHENQTITTLVDFASGMIDPVIQWLWDIAQNGLKIAVDIGNAIGSFFSPSEQQSAPIDAAARANARHGGIPTNAAGGPVRAGIPTLVGELGPELFTPGVSGTIHTAARTSRMLSGLAPIRPNRVLTANDNAANANARGPVTNHFQFGDIVVQGGANATPGEIAEAIGREVGADVASVFSDGGC